MKYSALDHGIKMPIADHEFDKVPEELSEDEISFLDTKEPEELWSAFCEGQMIDDADELHEAHEAIFEKSLALDILDKVYQVLQKYPPQGMNTDYMNVLLVTGRREELKLYLEKFL